jgi:hypothetical protein
MPDTFGNWPFQVALIDGGDVAAASDYCATL